MVESRWRRRLGPGIAGARRGRRDRRRRTLGRRRRGPGAAAVRRPRAVAAAGADGARGTASTRSSSTAARDRPAARASGAATAMRRLDVELDPESFASGPFGGLVLVGTDDGRRSTVSLARPAAAARRAVGDVDATSSGTRPLDAGRRGRSTSSGSTARTGRTSASGAGRSDGRRAERVLAPIDPTPRFGPTWLTELALERRTARRSSSSRAARSPAGRGSSTRDRRRSRRRRPVTRARRRAGRRPARRPRRLPRPALPARRVDLATADAATSLDAAGGGRRSRDAGGRPVVVHETTRTVGARSGRPARTATRRDLAAARPIACSSCRGRAGARRRAAARLGRRSARTAAAGADADAAVLRRIDGTTVRLEEVRPMTARPSRALPARRSRPARRRRSPWSPAPTARAHGPDPVLGGAVRPGPGPRVPLAAGVRAAAAIRTAIRAAADDAQRHARLAGRDVRLRRRRRRARSATAPGATCGVNGIACFTRTAPDRLHDVAARARPRLRLGHAQLVPDVRGAAQRLLRRRDDRPRRVRPHRGPRPPRQPRRRPRLHSTPSSRRLADEAAGAAGTCTSSGRCDVATLQLRVRHDVTRSTKYSTCLDLDDDPDADRPARRRRSPTAARRRSPRC